MSEKNNTSMSSSAEPLTLNPGEPLTWSCGTGRKGEKLVVKRYWLINLIAGLLHLVNAGLMLLFYYLNDRHDQLYDIKSYYATWARPANVTEGEWDISTSEYTIIQGLSLNWLIFAFHLLSFIFQIGVLMPCFNYQKMVDNEGRNPYRFIEYSLSASIMLVCIALLCGVRSFVAMLAIVGFTVLCQLLGLIAEYMPKGGNRNGVHVLAWVSIVLAYGIVLLYYVTAIIQNDIQPPDFVHIIVGTQAALFLSFGVVQTSQFCCMKAKCIGAIGRQAEISYCVLSLVAKTLLGWLIYANVIVSQD